MRQFRTIRPFSVDDVPFEPLAETSIGAGSDPPYVPLVGYVPEGVELGESHPVVAALLLLNDPTVSGPTVRPGLVSWADYLVEV